MTVWEGDDAEGDRLGKSPGRDRIVTRAGLERTQFSMAGALGGKDQKLAVGMLAFVPSRYPKGTALLIQLPSIPGSAAPSRLSQSPQDFCHCPSVPSADVLA